MSDNYVFGSQRLKEVEAEIGLLMDYLIEQHPDRIVPGSTACNVALRLLQEHDGKVPKDLHRPNEVIEIDGATMGFL